MFLPWQVHGLCGNYNDMQADDFKPPNGGPPLTKPEVFAATWQVHGSCPLPDDAPTVCPHAAREPWARAECAVIMSEVFLPCHTVIPPDSWYERCVLDTCQCDQGGDCECLCTALSAYAMACSMRAVHIKWRTAERCRMYSNFQITQNPPANI